MRSEAGAAGAVGVDDVNLGVTVGGAHESKRGDRRAGDVELYSNPGACRSAEGDGLRVGAAGVAIHRHAAEFHLIVAGS